MKPSEQRVRSHAITLAVRQYAGSAPGPDVPHVVLVHGYPDNQEMWRPVAERLAGAGLHVITYDVRGAGGSEAPTSTAGYRTELLVDDLVAVVEATVPDGDPVHLVGHDWGSVQLWEAVLGERDDPRLRGRIASFTSVSGPALEHLGYLVRHSRGRRLRLAHQLARSWYVYAFHLPVLPELVWRYAHRPVTALVQRREGAAGPEAERWEGPREGDREGPWEGQRSRDAVNGLNLYRANVLRRARPAHRRTDVPVLAVAPRRDPFLTSVTVEDLDRICSAVRVERPDTVHWLPRTDPELLARLVREQVTAHG